MQDPFLQGQIVQVEPVQFRPAQPQGPGGQGGAHQAEVVGRSAGGQPVPQLPGLGALVDRILIGEIDAAHPAAGQGAADQVGLLTLVDQHGQVGGAQGPEWEGGRASRQVSNGGTLHRRIPASVRIHVRSPMRTNFQPASLAVSRV